MIFDPTLFSTHSPLAHGTALRRWLTRFCLSLCLAVGAAAAVALFAPLI